MIIILYIWTNAVAFLTIFSLLILGYLIQRIQKVKIFTNFNIAISSIFCALSVVLTNVVGYSYIFGIQLMLGNFLIFLTGMMFGPMIGSIAGLTSDLTGMMINPGGNFHAGFMLIKVILGFIGGFVFLFKTNNFWKTKMIGFFSLAFLITSILSPIFLYALYDNYGYTIAKFIAKLIRFPFELVIYNSLIYLSFKISYVLLYSMANSKRSLWFIKNGTLKIKQKRSLHEKYKRDLYGNSFKTRQESKTYYEQINYNNINGVSTYE